LTQFSQLAFSYAIHQNCFRAYLQAKMAYETSIHGEATQEKQKHIEISAHLQKYRSDILPKGKCNGHA